jgi:hypothetical protein
MMERAEETQKKRRLMRIADDEANEERKREITRQGFRYCPDPDHSGNERYINAKYQGGPDLQAPFDNSSTTSGVHAANPFRPIFNPYTHRPTYQNKRHTKQRKNNNKHRNKQNKFTFKRQNEQEKLQAPKRIKRSTEEGKLKGKRPLIETEGHTQYVTPIKKRKTTSQTHSAEDHKKNNQENKRKRGATKKPATDKLFSIITNRILQKINARALARKSQTRGGRLRSTTGNQPSLPPDAFLLP